MEGGCFKLLHFLIFSLLLLDIAIAKECTNIPTHLSSHSFRFDLLSSNNNSWKEETFSHYHNHLIPTDDSAWSNLLPRNQSHDLDWAILYRKMKTLGGPGSLSSNFLTEFSLRDVRLHPSSIHFRAQQTNLEYLLMLDVDRLVWSFRKTAGLATPATPYGGWEDPKVELRGHFVGHYLSASAKMWASTNNRILLEKMSAVVSALSSCQEKIGSGYLSAFPSELFDRFEAIKPVWAPYYTIHKILAGLLDQYTVAGNAQALKMVTWMVDYFYKRVQNVIVKYSIERHWLSLNEETGGMNDVLYHLYTITNDPKHLVLAHLFDKPCFLGLLALQADHISGFHANTHIPIVIGSQMRYEITKDPLYRTIATYFMDIVNSSHSYATGGTSVNEFWSDPKRLASTLNTENEESCTTYNMLKVSRHLFTWTKEMAYADYYERALTNGVLSIQRGTEAGVMIYMLPMIPGGSKAKSHHGWGTKFDSFWCCYGTGIESFSKLGDSIYFEEKKKVPSLYIIQYISSLVNWKAGNVVVKQRVDPVNSSYPYLRAAFTFSPIRAMQGNQQSTLQLRIPIWTYSVGANAELNTQKLTLPSPGSFLTVTRRWSSSDKLTLLLPMALRIEPIKDDRPEYASIKAILYGPYLLAGLTHGDWEIKSGTLSGLISPIPSAHNSQLVSLFQQSEQGAEYVLTNSNQSMKMEKTPEAGTDSAVHATFRLVSKDPISSISTEDVIGKPIMLEAIAFPRMFVTHRGTDEEFLVVQETNLGGSCVFHLVSGLDGRSDTVSLESDSHRGCFVSSYDKSGSLKVVCDYSGSSEMKRSSSFLLRKGISSYDPISFVLKGRNRNFLLAPLLSLRDESYTVLQLSRLEVFQVNAVISYASFDIFFRPKLFFFFNLLILECTLSESAVRT